MKSAVITGLDIGTTRVRVVIGEYLPERLYPALRIIGVGDAPASGMQRDAVTDLPAATDAVRRAVRRAEDMAEVQVERVYAGIGGRHVRLEDSMGVVAVAGDVIDDDDVRRVHEVAQAVPLDDDRELLHAIPQTYTVDRRSGIRNPVGMEGLRVEGDVSLATVSSAVVGTLRGAVEAAGYIVQDVVLEPLAAARAVVRQEEREMGVLVVDIGGDSISLALFDDGRINRIAALSGGGIRLTSDLIGALSVPLAEANRIKEEYGAARASVVDPMETIRLESHEAGRQRSVTRRYVAELVERGLGEIMHGIRREVDDGQDLNGLRAGVVLVGGVAATWEIAELAARCFDVSARIGVPSEGLEDEEGWVARPDFATAVGLALHGADCFTDTGEGASTVTSGWVSKAGAWIREFF